MSIKGLSGISKAAIAFSAGGVLAAAIAIGAGSGNNGGSSPPAQVVVETATSVPEAQPTGRLDPQEPRTDCAANWTSYVDPDGRLSFCHPVEMKPITERRPDPELGPSFPSVNRSMPGTRRTHSL
jgi:hypothetical protein